MAEDSDTKHGNKNGKKEGISGSSFFTWFMVIALLGVWTSVAVVWFELVDYEEVLGKLGIYDADGDGDFDVEDAKVLLGLKERSALEKPKPRDVEEVIQQPSEQSYISAEHRSAEAEPEDEIQSLLREALDSQFGETDEEHEHEGTQFQQEENTETPEDTVDVPMSEEDYYKESEHEIPDIIITPESFEEELTSDHEEQELEVDEPLGKHEYDTDVEENTYEPVEPETFSEREEQQDYEDGYEMKDENYVESQDTDEVDAVETISEHTESDEGEHEKDHVDDQPHETEAPIQTEGRSKDDLVDT